jgi:hypothetical protein
MTNVCTHVYIKSNHTVVMGGSGSREKYDRLPWSKQKLYSHIYDTSNIEISTSDVANLLTRCEPDNIRFNIVIGKHAYRYKYNEEPLYLDVCVLDALDTRGINHHSVKSKIKVYLQSVDKEVSFLYREIGGFSKTIQRIYLEMYKSKGVDPVEDYLKKSNQKFIMEEVLEANSGNTINKVNILKLVKIEVALPPPPLYEEPSKASAPPKSV